MCFCKKIFVFEIRRLRFGLDSAIVVHDGPLVGLFLNFRCSSLYRGLFLKSSFSIFSSYFWSSCCSGSTLFSNSLRFMACIPYPLVFLMGLPFPLLMQLLLPKVKFKFLKIFCFNRKFFGAFCRFLCSLQTFL